MEVHLKMKELAEGISEPLVIFTKLQESGEIPEDWQRGSVVPILEKGGTFIAHDLSFHR